MVKNKIGGNKAKKFARKNVNDISQNKKLRFSQHEDEVYGIVNKIIGNGQVVVMCQDGKERLCFIRNKFSGRNKQSNLISSGSWVIVGKRSWETPKENKLEKCDLLEIYSNQEKHVLQQECNVNFTNMIKEEQKLSNLDFENEDDSVVFSKTEEKNNIENILEMEKDDSEINNTIDDIDFDDI